MIVYVIKWFIKKNGGENMERQYAGFWIRVLANILDSFILVVPLILMDFFAYSIVGPTGISYWEYQADIEKPLWSAYQGVSMVFTSVVGVAYFGILTSKYYGTLGKLIVGVRVVGEDGNGISLARSIGRYFAYIPSNFLMIGYIMVGFSSKKQGLHDKICQTYVVHK